MGYFQILRMGSKYAPYSFHWTFLPSIRPRPSETHLRSTGSYTTPSGAPPWYEPLLSAIDGAGDPCVILYCEPGVKQVGQQSCSYVKAFSAKLVNGAEQQGWRPAALIISLYIENQLHRA